MTVIRFFLVVTMLLVAYILVLAVYLFPWMGVALTLGALVGLARGKAHWYAFGTARWADASDISHMLGGGNGLIVGHIEDKPSKLKGFKALFNRRLTAREAVRCYLESCQRKPSRQLARINTAEHVAVFAKTGAGKGVSCVVPFLLTNNESCVVVDFKGELSRITADARRKMGHRVVLLDPYRVVTQKPDTLNVLDAVDPESPLAIDDLRDIAEAVVVRTGMEKERHFDDNAELWIAGLAAFLVDFGKEVSLEGVKTLLSDPQMMQAAIERMKASDAWGGILSRYGGQLSHFRDRELGSVLTTANRHLRFIDTPAISENTRTSSFDPAALLTGKMTIYLILPPDRMRAQSGLLRLWIAAIFRSIIRGGLQNKPVHIIIDEAASLGRMESLNDAIDKYRGYGIKLQLYFQSLGQLKTNFPEDQGQTLLSNTTQVFFAVNDPETAEHVSKRLGDQTIIIHEGGTNSSTTHQPSNQGGNSYSYTSGSSASWRQHGRPLLRPEEVAGLSERIAITFSPGSPPLWTRLIRYYEGDFTESRSIGLVKAAFDTACLFIAVCITAAMFTAGVVPDFWR